MSLPIFLGPPINTNGTDESQPAGTTSVPFALRFRDKLPSSVANELDFLHADLQAMFQPEHDETGSHRDVSVKSMNNTGAMLETGVKKPGQLNANTDDWYPDGLETARVLRVDTSAAVDLTGIKAQEDNRRLRLRNISANTITLKHDSTSSQNPNRFYGPGAADYALTQYSAVELTYDVTLLRWLIG